MKIVLKTPRKPTQGRPATRARAGKPNKQTCLEWLLNRELPPDDQLPPNEVLLLRQRP